MRIFPSRVPPFIPILLFFCLFLPVLHGAPLKNMPVTVKQPNGRSLSILASGDEYYNWLHDKNGYTIVQDHSTGWFVYARLEGDKLVPTGAIAGVEDPKAEGLRPGINLPPAVVERIRSERRLQKFREAVKSLKTGKGGDQLSGVPKVPAAPSTGTINNIVIFIRFAGEGEFTDPVSFYSDLFNTSMPGASSMHNYFLDASYGQLNISTTMYPIPPGGTVVSYQDAQPRAYYQPYDATTNPIGYQSDWDVVIREHTLLKNAANAVAAQIPSGLNLDADNDGFVDNVCFIISGSPGNWADLLWPHMWVLFYYDVRLNGKRIWTYNFQLQAWMDVGVLCHEMGHSIGLPDLYHYNGNGINPVYTWDLMEYQLNPPQHMGAYMKNRYLNWIASIPEITTAGTYTLNPLASPTGNAYKIKSPNSTTEYFVVEYRKHVGTFEGSLWGEGLLVYRINAAQDGQGNAGGPPDEVYLYRPDGTLTNNGAPWIAPFGAHVGRTAINDATNPSSFLSTGAPGGLNIYNITGAGNTISFTVGFPSSDCTITCPANYTTSTAPNLCGAYVNYPAPFTTGQCGTVVCAPAAGSFFPKGSTTVQCNTSSGPNCSFSVIVNDLQPPAISGIGNISVESDATCNGATVSWPSPGVSDNCPGAVLVGCSPASGSYFPVGVTTVTCSARDASGNGGTGTFDVNVVSRVRIDIAANPVTISFSCKSSASYTKAVTISNSGGRFGGGLLLWSATTGAPELTLSPASGTEGTALNVTVNPAGLAFGSYTRTITVTGKNSVTNTAACNSPYTLTVNIEIQPDIPVTVTQNVPSGSYAQFRNTYGHLFAEVKSNTTAIPDFSVTVTPCTYPNGMSRLRFIKRKFTLSTSAQHVNLDVRLYYTNAEMYGISLPGELKMFRQPAAGGAWVNLAGTSETLINAVTATAVSSVDGVFALAHRWTPKLLLWNLTSAGYDAAAKQAQIRWSSLLALNEEGFVVERKGPRDAEWSMAGTLPWESAGNYVFADPIASDGTYLYRIGGTDREGTDYLSQEIAIDAVSLPSGISLEQNYPNPFKPETTIRFTLPAAMPAAVKVCDPFGRTISLLADGEFSAGTHSLRFNAAQLPAGIYFYRLEAAGMMVVRRLTVIK